MPKYTTTDIRNLVIAGHAGAGKTSLVEALLVRAGVIGAPGDINKGTTVCDFDPEEKEHQHSLNSALASIDHGGVHVNLIDTPGMPDFLGHALAAFPAVETVAVVIDAHAGIEMVTRKIMEAAAERKLCRMIVINKIDHDNIDLPALVEQIRETFGPQCLPINLPAEGGSKVVDVFEHESGEADFSSISEAHTNIVEQVVEVDEETAMAYLEGEEVSPEKLHEVFEKALREGHLIPICFTSAAKMVGLTELLDKIERLMPNPTEGNPRPFEHGEGENVEALTYEPDPSKHVIAHVFKVTTDPFVGKLSVFRIHQGTITKDSQLYIGDAKKPFKVGHLFKLHGKEHKEVDAGVPGDICAVAKVEEIQFNDVLHDSIAHGHVHLKAMKFPVPMAGFAIESKSRGDEQKIAKALSAMEAEDPCFKLERGSETVIRGLGDMHLRVLLEKMKNRYNVEVDTHPPKIAYKETIGGKAEGHHRHKKQTGGAGQFGEVYLRVEPYEAEEGEGFEFVNDIFGGAIPGQFIPAIEKGVRQMLIEGCIAGYPMQNVRVSVYDGKYHAVDSKEVAFVTAARRAFADAVSKAKPQVLEPVVDLEITVPENNMGDIAGDLSSKRGRIMGSENIPGGMIVIKAQAPLAELSQYQNQLKSVTGGQGSYGMSFSHYEAVPPQVQQQLVSQFKPKADED
ncbi:elongation factor G [Planctomycetales bacterium ZRK34]|nr:elongation factor G [Planctomycetales bacterium ZRK34]